MDRENRYLLFLTENYAALNILKQYLQDIGSEKPVKSEQPSIKPWEMEPLVLFGSSFPKDKEYTQVKPVSPSLMHIVVLSCTGISKYQSNKNLYGDWKDSNSTKFGVFV